MNYPGVMEVNSVLKTHPSSITRIPGEQTASSADTVFPEVGFECEKRRHKRHTISGLPTSPFQRQSFMILHGTTTWIGMKTVATQTTAPKSPIFEILPFPSSDYPESAFSSSDSLPIPENFNDSQFAQQINPTLLSVPLSLISLPRTSTISASIYSTSPVSALSFISSLDERNYIRKHSVEDRNHDSLGAPDRESLELDQDQPPFLKGGRHEQLCKVPRRRASSFSISSPDSNLFEPYSSDPNAVGDADGSRWNNACEERGRSHFLVEALRNIPTTEEDLEAGSYAIHLNVNTEVTNKSSNSIILCC